MKIEVCLWYVCVLRVLGEHNCIKPVFETMSFIWPKAKSTQGFKY